MCRAVCVLCKKKILKANVNFLFGKRLGEDEAKSVTWIVFMKYELKNTKHVDTFWKSWVDECISSFSSPSV